MSADVVNLRRVRKTKARDAHAAAGAANRIRFGRTAAEREQQIVEDTRAARHLDAHLRERRDDPADRGDAD